ncbi:YlmC/YmxH family sporulation protein [Virgibacillus oceani]|uniref:PRC-barrel domain-containing protein n=1 Tax=Virgibacillus oceani TaxID=1479511 RepID=A0A917H756_9BACI|nr:YlmC/YmxH family sporulation protein [Virgibacillus oceani]GGG69698.1 hypothetical protein GCM10011398_12130 [Virgibacillus oceani]
MMKLSELQVKEIIVVEDGKRLGHIFDLELDVDNGKILSLIIMGKKAGLFGKIDEIAIRWEQIVTIGSDVILVRRSENSPQLYLQNEVK